MRQLDLHLRHHIAEVHIDLSTAGADAFVRHIHLRMLSASALRSCRDLGHTNHQVAGECRLIVNAILHGNALFCRSGGGCKRFHLRRCGRCVGCRCRIDAAEMIVGVVVGPVKRGFRCARIVVEHTGTRRGGATRRLPFHLAQRLIVVALLQ